MPQVLLDRDSVREAGSVIRASFWDAIRLVNKALVLIKCDWIAAHVLYDWIPLFLTLAAPCGIPDDSKCSSCYTGP